MQLNTVVLPAPLGPISAVISPRLAWKDRSPMATSPPNFIDRCSTLRIVSVMDGLAFISRGLPW